MIAGARLVLASADAAGDGARLSRLIRAEGVTFKQASAGEWNALIDSGLRPVRGLRALSGGVQGGPVSQELAAHGSSSAAGSGYAAAETSGYATLGRVQDGQPVTLGRPLANIRAYVVDAQCRAVPLGVPGELLIAGQGVAAGYVDGAASDDGGRFVADPFAPGRAFRTAERVRRRADGQLELVPGR